MASVSVMEPTRKIYSQVRKQSSWVPWGQTSQLPRSPKRENNEIVALLMQQVVCCQKLISYSNAFLMCSLAFDFPKAVFLRLNFYRGLEKALKILFAFKSTFQLLWIFETIDTCQMNFEDRHTNSILQFKTVQIWCYNLQLVRETQYSLQFLHLKESSLVSLQAAPKCKWALTVDWRV